jgi:hypothetical protein
MATIKKVSKKVPVKTKDTSPFKSKVKSRSNQPRVVFTKGTAKRNLETGRAKIVGGEAIGGAGKALGKAAAKKAAAAAKRAAARKRAATRKLTPEETGKAPVKKWGPGRKEYEATKKKLGIVTKKYPRKFMGEWKDF